MDRALSVFHAPVQLPNTTEILHEVYDLQRALGQLSTLDGGMAIHRITETLPHIHYKFMTSPDCQDYLLTRADFIPANGQEIYCLSLPKGRKFS